MATGNSKNKMSTESEAGKSSPLKFREPGQRDTVIRVKTNQTENNNARKPADLDSFIGAKGGDPDKKENPLLEKIKLALSQSDPAKWEHHGEILNPNMKYPKAYEAWEIVYCISIPNGILAFRSSQPVVSEYFGGGYTLVPSAPPLFYVELRPRAWDPRTLINPYLRSSLEKDKQLKLLADGEVARTIYKEIQEIITSFSSEQQKELTNLVDEIIENIIPRANASKAEDWTKNEVEAGVVSFRAEFDGIFVHVTQTEKNGLINYRLVLSKNKFSRKVSDGHLAQDLFHIVNNKNKDAALEALNDVLEKAGF